MVHRGPAPRACQTCRKSKVRCDLRPGGCLNCAKRERPCPGYPNRIDLAFHDESEVVARKADAARRARATVRSKNKQATSQEPLTTQQGRQLVQISVASKLLVPSYAPSPDPDDLALSFFFSHHVVGGGSRMRLPSDPHQDTDSDGITDALLASIKSVGLAGFSNLSQVPGLRRMARKRYTEAIGLVNAALQSPADVRKDSTLLAVINLSQFETIAGGPQRSLLAWTSHIQGAAALLNLRGLEQFKRPESLRLYFQAAMDLVTSCLQQGIAVPDHIVHLSAESGKYVNTKDPAWRVFRTRILFANFCAHLGQRLVTDDSIMLERALELDQIASSIFSEGGRSWEYQTIYTDADRDIVLTGCYHIYKNFMAAQVWNGVRTMRMTLNRIIRHILLADSVSNNPKYSGSKYTEQLQRSTGALYKWQADIIASVPQHLGYSSPDNQGLVNDEYSVFKFPWSNFVTARHDLIHASKPAFTSQIPLIRTTGGYAIHWSLFIVGSIEIATVAVRRWVLKILRLMGYSMGIQQALILADALEGNFAEDGRASDDFAYRHFPKLDLSQPSVSGL
ncbi:MAG: hypothetical protein M1819_000925 [Sarea resinae]|nr:MAG: hypothetical protein M1819_000925 [Sarea resinae]